MDEDTEMPDSASDVEVNPVTEKQIVGQHSRLRAMSERFNEQIAEDVVYDLVDEGEWGWTVTRLELLLLLVHRTDYCVVDFWSQCIGDAEVDGNGFGEQGTTALMDAETADALGSGGGREIKQLVQDEV